MVLCWALARRSKNAFLAGYFQTDRWSKVLLWARLGAGVDGGRVGTRNGPLRQLVYQVNGLWIKHA